MFKAMSNGLFKAIMQRMITSFSQSSQSPTNEIVTGYISESIINVSLSILLASCFS